MPGVKSLGSPKKQLTVWLTKAMPSRFNRLINWGRAVLGRAWTHLPHPKETPKPVEWDVRLDKGVPTLGIGLLGRWKSQGGEAAEHDTDSGDDALRGVLGHTRRRR
jgi:hypothetical protein